MARKTAAPIGDPTKRRRVPQQIDLFRDAVAQASAEGPVWPNLPEDTRGTLIGLMTQLILAHARSSAATAATEVSHDR